MGARILICDNEDLLRALVRASLRDEGYELVEAKDGEESLELARRTRPDVILLDLMMPGRSGIEVLRELRQDPELVHVRVAVVTARVQASDRAAADAAGADRFLGKPFSPRELADIVAELAGRRP